MGTPKLNVMVKDIGHVTINFSTVLMYQVNANQRVAINKMKTREWEIYGKLNTSKKTIFSLKQIVREIENK